MIIAIEGLIGAGKSLLTQKLTDAGLGTPYWEPVESNPFLEDYYADPARYAYAMQVNLLWERYKLFKAAFFESLKGNTCLFDRSYYGDMAFAIVQYERGFISDKEFQSYKNMHEILSAQLPYPDKIVWLELEPEIALERINKRARGCETGIEIDYLIDLNNAYTEVLEALKKRCTIITIDASKNPWAVLEDTVKYISQNQQNKSIMYY